MAIKYFDGEQWLELAAGERGPAGPTGNGISTISQNADYSLTITYTNGFSFTTSPCRGATGETGATGNGITSIAKTGTSGLVDTYTITFSNGSTTTFTVTNGEDGSGTPATALPQNLGTAAVGTSSKWAREDHIHATEIGTASVIIAAGDWSGTSVTKTGISGVTATNNIVVSPAPASFSDYAAAKIRATAQGNGSITFTCDTAPSVSVTVNVLILGVIG